MILIGSIRFAPPLVISEEDVRKAIKIIGESLEELDKVCSVTVSYERWLSD
jgi:acetylornithine/succinyldiaminopimelate/putrescine aminotransferase